MCGVIVISLGLTAYLAVYFTRRAKVDLEAALTPLAAVIEGTLDLENAVVKGQFRNQLAFGRMTNAEGGPVRVFQVDLVDPAGGESWLFALIRPRTADGEWEQRIEPEGTDLLSRFPPLRGENRSPVLMSDVNWAQVAYSSEGGYVRITRPMQTRKDIPGVASFVAQLEYADELAALNRSSIECAHE